MVELVYHMRTPIDMGIRAFTIMGILCVMATTALAEPKPPAIHPPNDSAQEKSSLIVTTDYIIGPEDVLDITVWKNADLLNWF